MASYLLYLQACLAAPCGDVRTRPRANPARCEIKITIAKEVCGDLGPWRGTAAGLGCKEGTEHWAGSEHARHRNALTNRCSRAERSGGCRMSAQVYIEHSCASDCGCVCASGFFGRVPCDFGLVLRAGAVDWWCARARASESETVGGWARDGRKRMKGEGVMGTSAGGRSGRVRTRLTLSDCAETRDGARCSGSESSLCCDEGRRRGRRVSRGGER